MSLTLVRPTTTGLKKDASLIWTMNVLLAAANGRWFGGPVPAVSNLRTHRIKTLPYSSGAVSSGPQYETTRCIERIQPKEGETR